MSCRKIMTVAGCMLVHFVIPTQVTGTIYCTGNFMPYITSRIKYETGTVSNISMTIVFYICIFTYALTFQITNVLLKKMTAKKPIYMGSIVYVAVVFAAIGLNERISIIIIYGVILGFGSGLAYAPSLMIAINCYPERKGFITGMVVGSFALGSFAFNFIGTAITNPDDAKPSVTEVVDGKANKYFEKSIADRVKFMFLALGIIYSALLVVALLLIKDVDLRPAPPNAAATISSQENEKTKKKTKKVKKHKTDNKYLNTPEGENHDEHSGPEEEEDEEEEVEESSSVEDKPKFKRKETVIVNPNMTLTFFQVLRTRQFWQMFFGKLLSGTAGLFAIASFKTVGILYGYDDSFLTIVGSIGSMLNGTLRPGWGLAFDKASYKLTYAVLLAIQITICASFPSVKVYKAAFFVWICFLYPCSGGHFTLLAPISIRIYGRVTGIIVYSFLIFAMGCASLAVYFLQTYVTLYLDYDKFFYILSGLSACSFISNLFFTEIIEMEIETEE